MRSFWAQPLRRQLLVLNLLLLVPVLGLAAWESVSTYRERRDELVYRARVLASTTAAYIDRDIGNFDLMAARIAVDPAVRALDRVRAGGVLSQIMVGRPGVLDVVLTDSAGRTVAHAATERETVDTGDWSATVTGQSGRVAVPLVAPGQPPGSAVVFAYSVADGRGTVIGGLGIYVDLSTRHEAFSLPDLPSGSVVTIADQGGRILAQSGDSEPDGIARARGEAPVDGGPWLVSVGIPARVAVGAAIETWQRTFAVLAFVLVGCFLMAWWFVSRLVVRSVSHLEATAQRIATGDFSAVTRRTMLSPEFAQLQSAIDAMLRRFNATRDALDSQMAEERRIRQKLEALQGQVIRQERLAAVGQLVSGVAHEINNPLQAILGFAELLQLQSDVPDSVKSDLNLIQKESTRACNIIRNLALFARQQPGEAGAVQLTEVIRAVAELRQRRLMSDDIELRIEDQSRQAVRAVVSELQQVVLNFVVNAEQAILLSGRLPGRITIRSFDVRGRVVLEVEDTGPGIPVDNEAKLFQPFFTTKPVGQGTGLGLSISYGIVDSLGGTIGYRRASAGGAVFYFELPVERSVASVPVADGGMMSDIGVEESSPVSR
jgi:signal transduction histidine kinase